MTWVPTVGGILTVTLPGEIMSATVTRLVDRNTAIVEIGQPMAKTHHYRKGDVVACRRKPGLLGETWEALDDRVLFARPQEQEPDMAKKPAPKKAAPKAAPKKVAPKKKAAKKAAGKK